MANITNWNMAGIDPGQDRKVKALLHSRLIAMHTGLLIVKSSHTVLTRNIQKFKLQGLDQCGSRMLGLQAGNGHKKF